ncbi:hypothetical protein DXG01_006956, partial [Tephrocybe rancida]
SRNAYDMSSLYAGYKHVSSFGDASEYVSDEEEEVLYVTLDLGSTEPSLVPSSFTYQLIQGLDTPAPFLRLSGTILKGRHETLLGSEILFTEAPDKRSLTPLMPPTTSTRICFSEVRLLLKGTVAPSTSALLPVLSSTTTTTTFHLASPGRCTTSTSKRRTRKGKDQDAQESWPAAADAASLLLDCDTGKNAPRARVPRTSTVSIPPSTTPEGYASYTPPMMWVARAPSTISRPQHNKTPSLHSP